MFGKTEKGWKWLKLKKKKIMAGNSKKLLQIAANGLTFPDIARNGLNGPDNFNS